MSKLRSIRTLGILFALMAYLFSITTLSPAGAETASIPVTVTASPTVGLVDGQAITVTVTAGSSPIYGVEARQCWAAGSIDYTADFSPTVSGKCAATALGSAGADVFQSVTTIAPHSLDRFASSDSRSADCSSRRWFGGSNGGRTDLRWYSDFVHSDSLARECSVHRDWCIGFMHGEWIDKWHVVHVHLDCDQCCRYLELVGCVSCSNSWGFGWSTLQPGHSGSHS